MPVPSESPTFLVQLAFLISGVAAPLVIRWLPRSRPSRVSALDRVGGSVGLGLCVQDLFVGGQAAFLAALPAVVGLAPIPAAILGALILGVSQVVMLLDLLIRREAGIRFSWHFLTYLRDLKTFEGSIQRGRVGLKLLVVLIVGLLLADFGWLVWSQAQWGRPRLDSWALGVLGGLGFLSLGVQRLMDPRALWDHQNIWFQFQRVWLGGRWRRSESGEVSPQEFLERYSPGERFELLDPSRPLYRLTQGYARPRRLELEVGTDRPHVVLLFLESFCAQMVGVLGENHGATPEFDRLSREGVLFRNFYANGVQTARAVMSGMYGILPRFTEQPAQADLKGCPRLIGVPDFFASLGYHTAYLHNGNLAFEEADLFFGRQGVRELVGREDLMALYPEARIVGGWGIPDHFLMRYCVEWLERQERRQEPGFATLFTMSNHHPFEVPEGHDAPVYSFEGNPEKETFLRTLHYSDACLGWLIRTLRERGLDRKCVFVILADTAQPLGEHDSWTSQNGLFEENVRIPLLILAPGRLKAPVVIDEPASQVDLLPTFIDLFGHPFAHHSMGTSLLRSVGPRPVWFNTPFGPRCIGQRMGSLKLIHEERTGLTRLYDLAGDPTEQRDLGGNLNDSARAMRSELLSVHRFVQELYQTDRFC